MSNEAFCPETSLDRLIANWTFAPSPASLKIRAERLIAAHRIGAAPASLAIKRVTARERWIVYFMYLPDGRLNPAHRFTLERLRTAGAGLAIICAAPTAAALPAELAAIADALYWKGLAGFDFSGFSLAIDEIASHSAGADTLIFNDSVFGPFVDIATLWSRARWELTGFTGACMVQNHIQSYAFVIAALDERKRDALRSVLLPGRAFSDYRAVVLVQETRFAAVAARAMSVGAWWYGALPNGDDPALAATLPLLRAGFPFVKRSLLGKHAWLYPDGVIADVLRDLGHPVDDVVPHLG